MYDTLIEIRKYKRYLALYIYLIVTSLYLVQCILKYIPESVSIYISDFTSEHQ